MPRAISVLALIVVVAASVAACGSSTANSADTRSASSAPSASPSPTPWPEMFAGTWVSTDEPANKLVFESDVAQASIRIKSDWWPIKFLFYGDKCKWTVSNLNFGPYELEGAGPAPFTGLYSWYDEAMDTTRFITVKFSGRTLWMRQAEDDPLSGTTNTYRYVLSDDGQSISYESSNYSPALTAHTSSGVYTRQ